MKTVILLIAIGIGFSAGAQTLKEALYGGKLKTDSGTVIRKGDDLASKIDTSTKKPVEVAKPVVSVITRDSSGVVVTVSTDSAGIATVTAPVAAPRDNNSIWKEYIDSLAGTLKTEVLTSKKIKDGVYSLLIEYEIGLDGQITVNSVSASPENSFLEQQVKERLTLTTPQLTPLLGTNGKPRKAVKKQMLTLTK